MPHRKKIIVPGIPVHITQRGVRRTNVFRDNEDRCVYLRLFAEASRRFDLRIYAYCLMTNHTHFVAVPNGLDSIWRTFHRINSIYGSTFNAKYGLSGRLWEERPRWTPTDESHFLAAVRYVELNPVRAGMIQRADEYAWSSARFHCGLTATDLLLDPTWPGAESLRGWSEWLSGQYDAAMDDFLRRHTLSGEPCGDDAFVDRLEALTGQTIRRRKPGPKPRSVVPF